MLGKVVSIIKSIYASSKLCRDVPAYKMPVRVSYNTVLKSLSGKVKCDGEKFPALRVGFDQVGLFDRKKSRAILEIKGELIINGSANFGQGAKICVGPRGVLSIGDKFNNTAETAIVCQDKITIGNNVLVSWDTLIMDTDFHACIDTSTGEKGPVTSPVTIGDNVWIGARSTILKGSVIPEGSIIGAASLVNKKFTKANTLIAGNPATIKKENLTRS